MRTPENIREHKPKDLGPCCIQRKGDSYYVYEATSRWDSEHGKTVKVMGRSLGKITAADGFIPNRYALSKLPPKPDAEIIVKHFGSEEMLMQLSPEINENLRKWFPMTFREIRTLALLRLSEGVGPALAHPAFLSSYMSELCPDLSMSEESVRSFVSRLGLEQERIDAYMRSTILPGTQLVFDGSSFFAAFRDSLSQSGYNAEHRKRRQIRLIYVFDRSSQRPQFYQVLSGSSVDKTAFLDVIQAAGISDGLVIGDKGFYTKKAVGDLKKIGIHFILPLQKNTALVKAEIYDEKLRQENFPGVFIYKNKTIYYRKQSVGDAGNFVYTFYDPVKASVENAGLIEKAKEGWTEDGYEDLSTLHDKHKGYFSFISDVDDTAQNVYLAYKERQEIEQLFDYLKNILQVTPAYAHSDAAIRGWAFLNHITALYFYGLIEAMRKTSLDKTYTPGQLIFFTKNVYAVKEGDGEYKVSSVSKKTAILLEKLHVDLRLEDAQNGTDAKDSMP